MEKKKRIDFSKITFLPKLENQLLAFSDQKLTFLTYITAVVFAQKFSFFNFCER